MEYLTGTPRDYNEICTDADVVLPSEHNGQPVGMIELRAFENCKTLKSIYIPNSIIGIGTNAFVGCGYVVFYFEGILEKWKKIGGIRKDVMPDCYRVECADQTIEKHLEKMFIDEDTHAESCACINNLQPKQPNAYDSDCDNTCNV